jgi:hypothetical protein
MVLSGTTSETKRVDLHWIQPQMFVWSNIKIVEQRKFLHQKSPKMRRNNARISEMATVPGT